MSIQNQMDKINKLMTFWNSEFVNNHVSNAFLISRNKICYFNFFFTPLHCKNLMDYIRYFSEYLLFAYQAVRVLKSKVFAQESTVVKWNYQILCLHQTDSNDFSRGKFTLKVQNWHFLTNCQWMETHNLVISFDYSWFLGKNLADPDSLLGEK